MKTPVDPLASFRSGNYPDRTRRAHEIIGQHYADFGDAVTGWWCAVRLSDGGSDGKLYRDKRTATRFQLHEKQCAYICLPPPFDFPEGIIPISEVHRYIQISEKVYDAGGRLSDEGTHIVPGSMK